MIVVGMVILKALLSYFYLWSYLRKAFAVKVISNIFNFLKKNFQSDA